MGRGWQAEAASKAHYEDYDLKTHSWLKEGERTGFVHLHIGQLYEGS
jgi:hypothetical protein